MTMSIGQDRNPTASSPKDMIQVGISINAGYPFFWMVYNGKSWKIPSKMDDLGISLFQEPARWVVEKSSHTERNQVPNLLASSRQIDLRQDLPEFPRLDLRHFTGPGVLRCASHFASGVRNISYPTWLWNIPSCIWVINHFFSEMHMQVASGDFAELQNSCPSTDES